MENIVPLRSQGSPDRQKFNPRELELLGSLLNHATVLEPDDHWWQREVVKALKGHPVASIEAQRKDLAADMRELLRVAHINRELFTTEWWDHRAHRALCEGDGIVGPGEDYIRQFRSKIDGTWSEWHLLTTAKRETSFAPSYHFVTDLGTDEAWTNLPGGPSESRFSQFYKSDITRWQSGVYKRLAGLAGG